MHPTFPHLSCAIADDALALAAVDPETQLHRAECELLASVADCPRESFKLLAELGIGVEAFCGRDTAAIFLALRAASTPAGAPPAPEHILLQARPTLEDLDLWTNDDLRPCLHGRRWGPGPLAAVITRLKHQPDLIRAAVARLIAIGNGNDGAPLPPADPRFRMLYDTFTTPFDIVPTPPTLNPPVPDDTQPCTDETSPGTDETPILDPAAGGFVGVGAFPPTQTFPVHAMPQLLASFVADASAAIGCDPSYIALPLLSATASAIGNTRTLRLKSNWSEPAVLWCAIVGDSGTMKSPAQELALRPVWHRQQRIWQEWRQQMGRYEAQRAASNDAPRSDRDQLPETPPECQHTLCADTTLAALAERLRTSPRGLLVAPDELRGWLGSIDHHNPRGGREIAQWLSVHRAGPLKIDRKTGLNRTVMLPHAAVSVCGGIQSDVLRKALTPDHFACGLVARLLLAMPPRRPKQWSDADLDPQAQRRLGELFDALYALLPDQGPHGDEPRSLDFSPAAKDAWVAFYTRHTRRQQELGTELAAAWSKLEGYCARFALIDHCVRAATGDAGNLVDERSVAAAVALTEWFGAEAHRVYGLLSQSDTRRHSVELTAWVRAHGGSATARDLSRALYRFRSNTHRAAEALDDLVASGVGRWVFPEPSASGGRPSARFVLST